MLLAYVDESSSDGYYFMGALIAVPSVVSQISSSLEAMTKRLSESTNGALESDAELHATEMWTGKGAWRHTSLGERLRRAAFLEAVELVCKQHISAIFVVIDMKEHEEGDYAGSSPHDRALMHLLERIQAKFAEANAYGVVVCDSLGDKGQHRRQHRNFQRYRTSGTTGDIPTKLGSIVDTLYFVDSHLSRPLQAIDLLTYAVRRKAVSRKPDSEEEIILRKASLCIESVFAGGVQ